MTTREVPDETALERIIQDLPQKPFLVGEDGVSMSLAGVQSKIGVHVGEGA
jgi:serine/threonine-protein kinase HipA